MIGTECITCKHYLGDLKCEAYPEKIPVPLLTGEKSHTKPYKGDGGLRYTPVKGFE